MGGAIDRTGSLNDSQTRHLLLQYTCAFAEETSLLFALANQKQRHAVLRSVGARVKMYVQPSLPHSLHFAEPVTSPCY